MDISPYIGAIVTVVVAIVGGWVAMKNANNANFTEIKVQISALSTQVSALKEQVEKHNNVVERTYKLETEVDNLYHRYDELRGDVKDVKIGGSE